MKVDLTHTYNSALKKIFIFLLPVLFLSLSVFSQGLNELNTVYLIGQVTNAQNGGPIKNHEVIITSDSMYNPHFVYTKKLYTDFEGYYYDTISTFDLKGGLNISTLDYLNNDYDTTVFFRFTWSEENILFANFVLPVQPQTVTYQANFYYQRDPEGNNSLEYIFHDLSNSDDIISWEWNFGDGNFSPLSSPKHTYSEAGVYRVKLTVVIQPTPYSIPYTTSIVKIISVTSKSYFHGRAYYGRILPDRQG
ncbi:MAG: PKD domain-containing protein [Bacteroidales bacterium]